jgi:hypothetical protein
MTGMSALHRLPIAFVVVVLAGTASAEEPKPDASKPAEGPKPGETTVEVVKPPPPPPVVHPDAAAPVDPFDAPSGGNVQARALFSEGRSLAKQGQEEEACKKMDASWSQEEALTTLFYVATCREREGKLGVAWHLYSDAAARAERDGTMAERAKYARDRAAALEDRLGTVVLRFDGLIPGTIADVDGRQLEVAAEVRERVDPGWVTLTAKGPSGTTALERVTVPKGGVVTAQVPPLVEQPSYRRRTWLVASGLLVVGGVITIGAGQNGPAALIGGAAIVGGVAVFLLAPRDRVTMLPMVTSTGGGVALGGRF